MATGIIHHFLSSFRFLRRPRLLSVAHPSLWESYLLAPHYLQAPGAAGRTGYSQPLGPQDTTITAQWKEHTWERRQRDTRGVSRRGVSYGGQKGWYGLFASLIIKSWPQTRCPSRGIRRLWYLALLGVGLWVTTGQAQPFAYVANESTATIPVGTKPNGIAVTPDGIEATIQTIEHAARAVANSWAMIEERAAVLMTMITTL